MRERIRIEGSTDELEALRRELIDRLDDDSVRIEPVSSAIPGELREPVVVALIVAFASTASVSIKTIGSIIERRMLHAERVETLRIIRERDEREISAAELGKDQEGPATLMIDVTQDLLDEGALDVVLGLFTELESNPETARMLQGRIAFRFPEQEDRNLAVFDDPSVRAWGRALFEQVPQLLYFLDPEPAFGATLLLPVSFIGEIDVDEAGEPSTGDLERALTLLAEYMLPAARFAEQMADDWRPILAALGEGVRPQLAAAAIRTVEASFRLADVAPDAAGKGGNPWR